MEKINIYVLTHKKFNKPNSDLYVSLQVGAQGKENLGYLCDNTGDNISNRNCYYSELTGLYWIWKNVKSCAYVGTCHYRRFLLNERGEIFNKEELNSLLKKYQIITTKQVELNYSYLYAFSQNHNGDVLEETGKVIKEIFPNYHDSFIKLVNENHTYFGNMLITDKECFDRYCSWLFSIFSIVENRVDLSAPDDYHRRVFGFISEFLLLVYTTTNRIDVYECKVGMVGEKAETKELKLQMAHFFSSRNFKGAREYFSHVLKERPDVLMEASDINGELKICMQIIITAQAEWEKYRTSVLDKNMKYDDLIQFFIHLNRIVYQENHLNIQINQKNGKKSYPIGATDVAIEISKLIHNDKQFI